MNMIFEGLHKKESMIVDDYRTALGGAKTRTIQVLSLSSTAVESNRHVP